METLNVLEQLFSCPTPSGYEFNAKDLLSDTLRNLVDEVRCDCYGNIIGYKYAQFRDSAKTVMLVSHLDEIGMMVTHIENDGFIRFSKIGNFDISLLRGRNVTIHNHKSVKGVVGVPPIYMNKSDSNRNIDISDLWVDIGTNSKQESETLVEIGDILTVDSYLVPMPNNLVSMRATDDKSGIAAIIGVLSLLKDKQCNCNLVVVASAQEEIGGIGALAAALDIKPDVCIAIDVEHATDYPGANRAKCGDVTLGNGAVIPVGGDLSLELQKHLKMIAKNNDVYYQSTALPASSGTDAHKLQILRSTTKVGLVSIPCRYMHSPVEIVSVNDINSVSQLLFKYCCSF